MKKSIAFSTLCLSLVTALMPALAQGSDTKSEIKTEVQSENSCKTGGHKRCDRKRGEHKKGAKLEALNLSEAQKTKMTELKTSLKASIKPKREELKTHRKALGELLSSDKIDKGAVQSEQDKINALSNDLANSMLAFRIDFNENLTADQRKQLKEMRASWGEKKHGRGHHQRNS
ncbi:Spy/CpxP family protein refolding chaperone [bacterium]|nr:Spy/CpxP family protein refolding chaperone [bacterium]MBP9807467.1 Spy/CpxP family protein refolding chaperone [bacterium]